MDVDLSHKYYPEELPFRLPEPIAQVFICDIYCRPFIPRYHLDFGEFTESVSWKGITRYSDMPPGMNPCDVMVPVSYFFFKSYNSLIMFPCIDNYLMQPKYRIGK